MKKNLLFVILFLMFSPLAMMASINDVIGVWEGRISGNTIVEISSNVSLLTYKDMTFRLTYRGEEYYCESQTEYRDGGTRTTPAQRKYIFYFDNGEPCYFTHILSANGKGARIKVQTKRLQFEDYLINTGGKPRVVYSLSPERSSSNTQSKQSSSSSHKKISISAGFNVNYESDERNQSY